MKGKSENQFLICVQQGEQRVGKMAGWLTALAALLED